MTLVYPIRLLARKYKWSKVDKKIRAFFMVGRLYICVRRMNWFLKRIEWILYPKYKKACLKVYTAIGELIEVNKEIAAQKTNHDPWEALKDKKKIIEEKHRIASQECAKISDVIAKKRIIIRI